MKSRLKDQKISTSILRLCLETLFGDVIWTRYKEVMEMRIGVFRLFVCGRM